MFLKGGKAGAEGAGAEFSFIGPEVVVTGNVETPGRLHVDGRIVGDLRCGVLSQGESGAVIGNIVAGEARLAGLVDGAVEAGSLSLEGTAKVTGDILYESVGIARGAEVEGRLKRRRAAGDGSAAAKSEGPAPPPGRARVTELFAPPEAEAAE